MSTHSAIILKVREEDKGKKMKFDASKLPNSLEEWLDRDSNGKVWRDERDKDKCKEVTIKGDYIGIYCHWDGDYVGNVLKKHFNDYDSALNLILGGFCSYVESDSIKHYANREGEEWKYIKPIQGSLKKVKSNIDYHCVYVFEDGFWDGNC